MTDLEGIVLAPKVIQAYNHDLRRGILKELLKCPCTVNELVSKLDKGQSYISQQLRVLKQASLVSADRDGTYIIYSANESLLKKVVDFEKSLANS